MIDISSLNPYGISDHDRVFMINKRAVKSESVISYTDDWENENYKVVWFWSPCSEYPISEKVNKYIFNELLGFCQRDIPKRNGQYGNGGIQ